MFNESRKFANFSKIWKQKEIKYLCYLCKTSWVAIGWNKTAPPPHRPGPETVTAHSSINLWFSSLPVYMAFY